MRRCSSFLLRHGFERVELFRLFGGADYAPLPPFPSELVALVLCGVGTDIREGRRAIVNPPILRRNIHVWRVTVPLADEAAPRRLEEDNVRRLRRANDTVPMRRPFLRQLDTPNEHEAIIERPRFNRFPNRDIEGTPPLADRFDWVGSGGVSVGLNGEGYAVERDPLPTVWEIQKLAFEVTGGSRRKGDYAAVLSRFVAEATLRIIGRPICVHPLDIQAVVVHCHFTVMQGYRSHKAPFIKTRTV